MSRRVRLALWLAVLAAVLTAVPMAAGDSSGISVTEAGGVVFPDRAFLLTLPKNEHLTASQVQVLENGNRVSGATIEPVGEANSFGIVLALDSSLSMQGKPAQAALAAAQTFAEHRAGNEQLGVVTYNAVPTVALPLTLDQTKIDEVLAEPPAFDYGTHIFDAVVKGLDLLRTTRVEAGSIVVLSDGREHPGFADTAKHATEEKAAAAARAAHVRVFTVGLRSKQTSFESLQQLARDTGGRYVEAKSLDALTSIYSSLGSELAHEYLLRYRSTTQPGTKVWLTVKVNGQPGAARSGYATLALPAPPPATYKAGGLANSFWTSPFTMIVFGVFAVGLVSFCVVVLLVPRRRTLQRRLAEFVSLAEGTEGKSLAGPLSQRIQTTEKSLEQSPFWARFVEDVELAEINMRPTHILIWTLIGTIVLMWGLAVFVAYPAVVFGLLVPVIVYGVIRGKVERKRSTFAEQLPDNLAVLASAVRAGHSFVGALSVVVEDAPEPSHTEFGRVVADEQLGRPLEDALDLVATRMKNKDLGQVALVAVLQRETGGSTAEVLDRVVDTVRERQDLRRLVRTLTAAGRLSRWIVSGLPLVLILAITIINPGYLHPLFAHTGGQVMFVFAGILVISGSYVIKRIVDIKV